MSTTYDAMWEKLNLDLDAHAGLLEVLGKFYGDIYLSQSGRLRGMEYLDFVLSEVHGLRIKELQDAKAAGKKVVGTFCVFVPEEIVLAAGAVQVGLCAGAEIGKETAEKVLPRNTCALIKSFVGFKLSRLCPYIESCDLVVGETTCDGKKKAYEIFSDYAPVYVMEIPQMKQACDRELWKAEILRFKDKIEEVTGKTITAPRPQGSHSPGEWEAARAPEAQSPARRQPRSHFRPRRPADQPDQLLRRSRALYRKYRQTLR